MDLLQKYEFGKLKTFMEDLTFLLQRGGATNPVAGAQSKTSVGRAIWDFMVSFVMVFMLLFAIYIIYFCLFKGYPRFVINIATLSFFHKEKFEKILLENDTLFSNFDMIADMASADVKPLKVLDGLYSDNKFTELGKFVVAARILIENNFATLRYKNFSTVFRYRDKYKEAFVEYFLFYKILNSDAPDIKELTIEVGANDFKPFEVAHYKFYEQMIVYLQLMGAIPKKNDEKPGEISQNKLMYDMFITENNTVDHKKLFQTRYNFHKSVRGISGYLLQAVNLLEQKGYHYFFLCPNTDANISNIIGEFQRATPVLRANKIYDQKASRYSTYFWTMVEVYDVDNSKLKYESINIPNDKYKSQAEFISKRLFLYRSEKLPNFTGYQQHLIVAYLNTPGNKRKQMEKQLLKGVTPNQLQNIQKYPIFASIYYSNAVGDKVTLYYNIMQMYKELMTSSGTTVEFQNIAANLQTLVNNARQVKQTINSIHVLNLYLNVYRNDFTRMITLRNLSDRLFFKELITSHADDIFNNRIKAYFLRISTRRYFNKELIPAFKQRWDDLGDILDNMMRTIWNAFKQKDESNSKKYDQDDPRPVEQPEPLEKSPDPDTSGADAKMGTGD
jgi:hypothetical protein